MQDDKYEFYKREFLNRDRHHGMAAYLVYIYEVQKYGVDAYLELSDCSRQISIDFSFHNEKGAENSFEKLDKMMEALKELKRNLRKAKTKWKKLDKES